MRSPGITYVEWLPTGVMVHFTDSQSVFFPSQFLVEHRDQQPASLDEDEKRVNTVSKCVSEQKSSA